MKKKFSPIQKTVTKGEPMPNISPIKQSRPSKVLYLGAERCQRLRRCSVEVSFHSGHTVSTSQFTQYLIDKFDEVAKKTLIEELKHSNVR
ncbi:hypothetical protein [Serratia symbiotica]|uniref:hypothetical protein n=1 Tax=Serratia symbiotica TaxID=138074 RepID=UPI0013621186|nr:hypothetical protein [Serratia symbiotica]